MTARRLWIVPAFVLALGACDDDTTQPPPEPTIVDVAVEVNATTDEFSTLIAALAAADLVDVLAGPGPFTVFAPTDAAFAALDLDASNIGALPTATLRDILLYHVAPERRYAAAVTAAASITMANGGTARISVGEAGAFIEDARLIQTDIVAANGVIHVIDAVLIP
jgi:uncharacterized surface protein with fasciclin (FAS1) repeats